MPGIEDAVRRNAFLASVVGWWRERRLKGREGDLNDLDDHELARMAGELGITRSDLMTLAAQGPQAARLMERMLALHHLDPQMVAKSDPGVLRDMELHCSQCGEKQRCARELAAGTALSNAESFCPNAPTMKALLM